MKFYILNLKNNFRILDPEDKKAMGNIACMNKVEEIDYYDENEKKITYNDLSDTLKQALINGKEYW